MNSPTPLSPQTRQLSSMTLVFSLRSVVDTSKFDRFNRDTWKSLLEPFGYVVDEKFYEELLAWETEVDLHQTLMPLTMPSDFDKLQKIRYTSLEECIRHAKPLEASTSPFPLRPGVLEFLETIPRYVLNVGEERSYTFLLTNVRVPVIEQMFRRIHDDLFNCFDLVTEYVSSNQYYRDMVSYVRSGGVDSSSSNGGGAGGRGGDGGSGVCPPQMSTTTCALADSFERTSLDRPPKTSPVIFFETTAEGVRRAVKAGGKAVGIAVGRDTASQLTEAGALFAVEDYTSLKLEYLPIVLKSHTKK